MIDKGQAMVDALRGHYDVAFNSLVNAQSELAVTRDRVAELEQRVKELEQEKSDGVART